MTPEQMILLIRDYIYYGYAKKYIIDKLLSEGYRQDDIFLAYKAALILLEDDK